MRLSWPLIGRSEQMRSIEAALSSDGSGIVVWGEAGVGKSRLAREAIAAGASRGWEPRWAVGASSGQAVPLGAFTAWTTSGATDTVQLVRGVIESLTAAPPGMTVVVAVDDAHLLDDLSTFVLHQIVQRGAAKVILTVLDGEPIPAAVQEIWKVGRFDRVDLPPLTLDETTSLLSTALGGSVDPDAALRLWQLTRGNALYLRTIVEQEIADGRIVAQRGYWRWIGDPVMPHGLVAVIEARIGALPAGVSDVVDVLAVGEPTELAALRRITDPAAVEEADIRGLVAVELARADDGDDVRTAVRRATLTLDSDLAPDVDLLVRAAHGAVWLADLPLPDRIAEAAVRAGAGAEPNFVRAHALSWLGRGEEADAVFAQINPEELTDRDRARFAFLRASNMLWALGDPARAKDVIDEASRVTPQDARSYVDAFLTVYWFATDQPEAAVKASHDLAIDDLPPVVGAEIAWLLATIAADAGRTAEAVAIAESGYVVATRSFDAPHMRFNIADAPGLPVGGTQHRQWGDAQRQVLGGQDVGYLAGPLPTDPGGGQIADGRPRGGAHVPAVCRLQFACAFEVLGDECRIVVHRCWVTIVDRRGKPPVPLGAFGFEL
jgi:hypothetical protein